jgi:ribosomal-protein-serine acetyltransferase
MFRASVRPGIDLRLVEERHATPMFALVDQDRAYLREWLPWVDATLTEDDTLSFIRSTLEQLAGNRGFTAGIWKDDRVIGVIGTQRIDWLNRKVELGYWLGQAFQGNGIMTDVCRTVVTYILGELNLHRVEIRCASGNAKSLGIPRRLGFSLEGTIREAQLLHNRYHDLVIFGMLKDDWTVSNLHAPSPPSVKL